MSLRGFTLPTPVSKTVERLSKLLGTKPQSPNHALSVGTSIQATTSALRLTELPTEILEQILLHLPGQDIIKMDAVRR